MGERKYALRTTKFGLRFQIFQFLAYDTNFFIPSSE